MFNLNSLFCFVVFLYWNKRELTGNIDFAKSMLSYSHCMLSHSSWPHFRFVTSATLKCTYSKRKDKCKVRQRKHVMGYYLKYILDEVLDFLEFFLYSWHCPEILGLNKVSSLNYRYFWMFMLSWLSVDLLFVNQQM